MKTIKIVSKNIKETSDSHQESEKLKLLILNQFFFNICNKLLTDQSKI